MAPALIRAGRHRQNRIDRRKPAVCPSADLAATLLAVHAGRREGMLQR
jgi:hypothetical protein